MKAFYCKLHAPRPDFAQTMTPAEMKLMQEHGAYLRGFAAKRFAVAFGPEVARYVKGTGGKLKMVIVPDNNERVDGEKVPFHFNQSMGVRKGDEKLLEGLDAAIEKAEPQIHAILEEEGIPLLQPTQSNVTPKS